VGAQIHFDTYATTINQNDVTSLDDAGTHPNVTNKMVIDQNGRVTMPLQPLFNASDSRAIDLTNVVLTSSNFYNEIDHNIGNHFNATNGRFTAPISGFYEVTGHFASSASNSRGINVRIRKNGTVNGRQTGEIYNDRDNGSVNNFARFVIELSAGDYIDIQANRLIASTGRQHKRIIIRLLG
jgi:hypothetical protein